MKKRITCCLFAVLWFALLFSACSHDDAVNADSNNTSSLKEQITSTEDTAGILPDEYDMIIKNIINAYPWNDDDMTIVPENPELSYMYRRNASLSEIGFALVDLDNNGQTELIISDINKPFIYDLYTISDGEIVHLFDSGERHFYLLYEKGLIRNTWSGSAATTGNDFYRLSDGKLEFVERITMDAYQALDAGLIDDLSESDENNSFFRSESEDFEDYRSVPFDEAIEAIEAYLNENAQLIIEYTLLSEYKK